MKFSCTDVTANTRDNMSIKTPIAQQTYEHIKALSLTCLDTSKMIVTRISDGISIQGIVLRDVKKI